MKALAFVLTALISILLVSAAVPTALADDGETAADQEKDQTNESLSTSVAFGKVCVTVVEWRPDLAGIGAGLFTHSGFDFSKFFDEVGKSLASLLGL